MAIMNSNYNIECNRGSMLSVTYKFRRKTDGMFMTFENGDVIRFKIMEKGHNENVILQKDFEIAEHTDSVNIMIPSDEMKIGEMINKPVDYWYEIELNPDKPSTITLLGFTKATGGRIFTLSPEGGDKQ